MHIILRRLFLVLALCALGSAAALHAQGVDYYLKFTGPAIVGSSVAEGYNEGHIEVQSYAFYASVEVTVGSVSVPWAGNPAQFDGVECLLALDPAAYPALMNSTVRRLTHTDVVLVGRTLNGGGPSLEFLKLEMKNVIIESLSHQGNSGDRPVLSVRFRPTAIRLTSKYLDNNGTEQTATPVLSWNFLSNTPNFP